MNAIFSEQMRLATDLTRQGRLSEATTLLQTLMQGSPQPDT